ncbi:hypothetical protein [Actinoplanes sp. NPDC048796]|uniref:hypothetical protein n=1 Tax=Actinoplanes sp. NPDC048796 TaxID=3155640 RepID=UPI0033FE4081
MIKQLLGWVALAVAAVTMVVFLTSQQSDFKVTYAGSPGGSTTPSGGRGSATVPDTAELTRLLRTSPVVRLPGAIAQWDTTAVGAAIGDSGLRILVTPPGLDDASTQRVQQLKDADLRVIGTAVSTGTYAVTGTELADWRDQFATGDVTNDLLLLIAHLRERPEPVQKHLFSWRAPTAAETAVVAADLRSSGFHRGRGSTVTSAPRSSPAFPNGRALYVTLPLQPFGRPVPEYGPALVKLFPDTPIVVMYGAWIEYYGPHAADFAEIAAATFYSQAERVLDRLAYSQQGVLDTYLNRVTDVRFAGLFDRPLPYEPPDPLRVTRPALPWVFVACVVLFVALSLRPMVRPVWRRSRAVAAGTPAQLAALTALAVEMSALTDRRSEPALARALVTLTAARDASRDDLPDEHVRALLRDAEAELDRCARLLPYRGYRPAEYLNGRIA